MKTTIDSTEQTILEIAKKWMFLNTLDSTMVDSQDFSDQHVASIKSALMAAFEAGQDAARAE